MTAPDALGLGRLVPAAGWVVLDAARDRRFTGELVLAADEIVRVYFDRGQIYLAERDTDPPLGTRLIEAGAITRSQLEYGRIRVHDIEHLGRLFERVPTVSRDGVMAVTDLMNEQTVSWLAAQQVTAVTATPYRHHGSGMHQWTTSSAQHLAPTTPPEMTLPTLPQRTPDVDDEPAPGVGDDPQLDADDDLVEWDEPTPAGSVTSGLLASPSDASEATDIHGVPGLPDSPELDEHAPPDPAPWDGPAPDRIVPAPPGATIPPPVQPVDRFEVIWPTGEVDDVSLRPDHEGRGPEPDDHHDDVADDDEPHDDDGAIAVRRAVATIDTGSLAARRRLVESTVGRAPTDESVPPDVMTDDTITEPPTAPPAAAAPGGNGTSPTDDRAGALRRLISSLRR